LYCLIIRRPTHSTIFPYTTLFRSKIIKKEITRGAIPIYSISAAYMIDKETGFIKIDQFSVTTDKEFKDAAERLKAQGMKKLVLRSEEHTSELQSRENLVCRLLLEK